MREREREERGGGRRGIERESENHKEGGKYTNGLTATDFPPPLLICVSERMRKRNEDTYPHVCEDIGEFFLRGRRGKINVWQARAEFRGPLFSLSGQPADRV